MKKASHPQLLPLFTKKRAKLSALAFGIIVLIIGFPILLGTGVTGNKTAEYYFLPLSRSFVIGETIPVELRVKTSGDSINAIGFVLTFDPTYLEIMKMTTDKSFCTFYTENSFNNDLGRVRVACGAPNPGFRGDSLAVGLQVRAKVSGRSPLSIEQGSASILANDGKGSNILKEQTQTLTITALPI